MAAVFYAWEFGANFGHIGAFLPLAETLRGRGHEVHWAVAQTGPAARLLAPRDFSWFQAPLTHERVQPGPPLTYADILLRFGYADPQDLLGLVVAWRALMTTTGSRLVFADHAPTAVLAASTLGLPVMLFSNGFTVPPRTQPLPAMRYWQPLADEVLQRLDGWALGSVNTVRAHFGLPPLDALCQLFDVAEEAMVTYPELDHYPHRGPARYWGCLPHASGGSAPQWPDAPGKRIFVYLRMETPHWEQVLDALQALGHPALVFIPGLTEAQQQRWSARHLRFSPTPVDMAAAVRDADLAITYASLATTTAFLMAGKPILMVPGHLEQFLLSKRVEAMGAGRVIGENEGSLVGERIRLLMETPAFAANARAFADKYAAFPQDRVITNLARRTEELLGIPRAA